MTDKSHDRQLDDVLNYDPMAALEGLTGVKGGSPVGDRLGLSMALSHNAKKRQMLEERDDTTYASKLDRYLRIVGEEGFREILKLPFTSSRAQECLYVMYHEGDGILLVFDTSGGENVNGGKFYYNIKLKPGDSSFRATSSGSFLQGDERIWVGDHDCREALRHHIAQLRANGEFIREWVAQPFLWILHHGDTKVDGYDHKAITAERIAMFPIEVQKAIAGRT